MVHYPSIIKKLLPLSLSLLTRICGYAQPADTTLNTAITTAKTIKATHSITLSNGFSANGANGAVTFSIVSPALFSCTLLNTTLSADQNYISTYIPRIPIVDASSLSSHTACEVMQAIQYFDGLGRPLQTVQVKGNPGGTADVIQPVAYDQFGREATKYLHYTSATGAAGSYRPDALTAQNAFYQLPGQNYAQITVPSATTGFEPSPLNRVLEQGAPGADWQLGGHTVRMDYGSNDATSVTAGTGRWARLYTVDIDANGLRTLNDHGATGYNPNELYVTVSKDENWVSGKDHTTEEYKDKEGHVVVKRTFNGADILSTYYVYDDFGNLSYVLPPMAEPDNGSITGAELNNLCYQYTYDERNRLVTKKIPGSDAQYMVYNLLDQVVATQDGNQRQKKQWLITKYDALGRVIMTGTWTNGNTATAPSAIKTSVYGQSQQWENRDATQTFGYTQSYTYPNALDNVLSVNYYDDYTFPFSPRSYYVNSQIVNPAMPSSQSQMTKGLPTGSLVAVLNGTDNGTSTANMLWTVNYYDDKGRIIQAYAQHYLGGTVNPGNYDEVSNNYDFTNAVTQSIRVHHNATNGGTPATLTIANSYIYDHMGRKRQTLEQVNNTGDPVIIAQNDYNEVGQEWNKHLHSTDQGASFLQTVNYAYNQRGWLTHSGTDGNLFNMDLNYNNPGTGIGQQWNGNISAMTYNTTQGTGAGTHQFIYSYDPLNRLLNAASTRGQLDETISYDKMGNIMSLTRGGVSSKHLDYHYIDANGNYTNQLQTVQNNQADFRAYGYDLNGNATSDGNITAPAGIKTINYNLLNLPQSIIQGGNTAATYIYNAGGNKLRNIGNSGTWDYDNGVVYQNNVLSFIQTEEGRISYSNGTYNYEYNLKDHLGNTRVSFDKYSEVARVVQEDEYYSFGLRKQDGYNFSNGNRYLYNGKEIQTDLDGQYDYGARFYDPVIARWTSVDAWGEHPNQISKSPYAYGWDNPVKYTDPDGNCPMCIVWVVAELVAEYATVETVTATVVAAGSTAVIINTSRHLANERPIMTRDGLAPSPVFKEPIRKSNNKKDDSDSTTPKDPTANRVNPRKGTKAQVAKDQPKNDKGEMLDPNTGQVLDPEKTDLGHRPGQEWSKRKKEHQEKGSTRKEVIEAENDPNLYQYEDRSSNRSHKHEQKQEKKT